MSADLYETAYEIGCEGYAYLYPIVLMDVTRKQMTNATEIDLDTWQSPANVFMNNPRFPGPDDRTVVRPNFDTLYSSAWLDLLKEPMVIKVPPADGRYYLLPMLDMWTDVIACPGPRTTGTAAQQFVIVGPGWSGTINPALKLQRIDASTPYVWIIGRTQCDGSESGSVSSYDSVHEFQNGLEIIPYSAYAAGQPAPPPVGSVSDDISLEEPLVIVEKMSPEQFFAYGANLLSENPAHFNDYPILARLARVGFVAGQPFNLNEAPAEVQEAFTKAVPDTLAQMKEKQTSITPLTNGWTYANELMGTYGTSYLRRAIVALIGLGANLPEDAIYPVAYNDVDADSKLTPLDSALRYTLRFEATDLPPVNAFWSVTMYDEQGFQVPNAINRFSLGTRNNLATDPSDGSVTVYVQNSMDEADPRRSNWLPAPQEGAFNLTLRLYWPEQRAVNADWHPPAITRAK